MDWAVPSDAISSAAGAGLSSPGGDTHQAWGWQCTGGCWGDRASLGLASHSKHRLEPAAGRAARFAAPQTETLPGEATAQRVGQCFVHPAGSRPQNHSGWTPVFCVVKKELLIEWRQKKILQWCSYHLYTFRMEKSSKTESKLWVIPTLSPSTTSRCSLDTCRDGDSTPPWAAHCKV